MREEGQELAGAGFAASPRRHGDSFQTLRVLIEPSSPSLGGLVVSFNSIGLVCCGSAYPHTTHQTSHEQASSLTPSPVSELLCLL